MTAQAERELVFPFPFWTPDTPDRLLGGDFPPRPSDWQKFPPQPGPKGLLVRWAAP
jgi:hypothetical protein